MDFGDVPAGKLHDCRPAIPGLMRRHEDLHTQAFCLVQGLLNIRDFISRRLIALELGAVSQFGRREVDRPETAALALILHPSIKVGCSKH